MIYKCTRSDPTTLLLVPTLGHSTLLPGEQRQRQQHQQQLQRLERTPRDAVGRGQARPRLLLFRGERLLQARGGEDSAGPSRGDESGAAKKAAAAAAAGWREQGRRRYWGAGGGTGLAAVRGRGKGLRLGQPVATGDPSAGRDVRRRRWVEDKEPLACKIIFFRLAAGSLL